MEHQKSKPNTVFVLLDGTIYSNSRQPLTGNREYYQAEKQVWHYLDGVCSSIRDSDQELDQLINLDPNESCLSWYYTLFEVPATELRVKSTPPWQVLSVPETLVLNRPGQSYRPLTVYQVTVDYQVFLSPEESITIQGKRVIRTPGKPEYFLYNIDWEDDSDRWEDDLIEASLRFDTNNPFKSS